MNIKEIKNHPISKIAKEVSKLEWDILINMKAPKVDYLIIGTTQRIEEISEILKDYNPYTKIIRKKFKNKKNIARTKRTN